jgi:hypothetical protein
MTIEAERGDCLRINAPHWFTRTDFCAWLNHGAHVATWHTKGEAPSEYSDVFVTIDGNEGIDANGIAPDAIPEDIWDEIVSAAKRVGIHDGIVWISNVEIQGESK